MKANKRRKEQKKVKRAEKKAKKEIVRFYLIFSLLFLIIVFVFPFVRPYFYSPILIKVSSWTAGVVGFFINLFGMNADISGPVLALNKFSIRVVSECTGLYEMFIFLVAVLAYPANYKKKLLGLFFGIPALYIINILRMVFITVIGNWNPKTFEFMHLYFWQVAGILIIGGLWLFWIEKIVKYERETKDIHS